MRVQTGPSLGRFLLTICLQSAKNLKRVHLRPKEGPREQHWAASAFVTRATLCSPTLDCYHRNQYTSSYVHVPAGGGAGASPIPACAGAAPLQDPFGEISKSRFSAHAVDRPRRRAASPHNRTISKVKFSRDPACPRPYMIGVPLTLLHALQRRPLAHTLTDGAVVCVVRVLRAALASDDVAWLYVRARTIGSPRTLGFHREVPVKIPYTE